MALGFFVIGIAMIMAALHHNSVALMQQLQADGGPFLTWLGLIVIVWLLGLSRTFRPMSNAFMALIVVAFLLKEGKNVITGLQNF